MSVEVKKITQKEFGELLEKSEKPVLVDFFAEWCGPCKMQAPIIEEVAAEVSEKMVVVKMDADECYDVCEKYEISAIPTLILFKKGEVAERSVGLTSRAEISDMIVKHV